MNKIYQTGSQIALDQEFWQKFLSHIEGLTLLGQVYILHQKYDDGRVYYESSVFLSKIFIHIQMCLTKNVEHNAYLQNYVHEHLLTHLICLSATAIWLEIRPIIVNLMF